MNITKTISKYLTEKAIKIDVYDKGDKTIDRYTVIIAGVGYLMSENPGSLQGVNEYIGKAGTDFKVDKSLGKKLREYPKGVAKAIREICDNIRKKG